MRERETVYQLNENEQKLVIKSLKEHKEGYTGIKESHIKYFFYFSLFLMAFLFLSSTYFIGILPTMIEELLKTYSLYSAVGLLGYSIIFVIFIIFYYRIGAILISKGEINKKDLAFSIPGLKYLYLWIKGGKNDD